jgi:hypothetical protein
MIAALIADACNAPHKSSGEEGRTVATVIVPLKLIRGFVPQRRMQIILVVVGYPEGEAAHQIEGTRQFLQLNQSTGDRYHRARQETDQLGVPASCVCQCCVVRFSDTPLSRYA